MPVKPATKGVRMIISFFVDFNKLVALGRKYPWPKPEKCLCCNGCRIWGHGYVPACFDRINHAIEIKRCRCPDCKCVYRFRPKGYFNRFQADIATVRLCIASKVRSGKWLVGIGRTRQRQNIWGFMTDMTLNS